MHKVLLFVIIALGAAYAVFFHKIPVQVLPIPFDLKQTVKPEFAPITVVGDRMAKKLSLYLGSLNSVLSADLSKPISISVNAKENYGIHRTFAQLKAFEKFPKVVIYQGASQEEVEYKFLTSEATTLLANFEHFEDPNIRTLLMLAPTLSKFVYKPVTRLLLENEIVIDPNQYEGDQIFKRTEIEYKLYEHQLEEMIKYVQKKGSFLILMTTPLNPRVKPKKTCSASKSTEVNTRMKEIIKDVKNKEFKTAFQKAKILHYIAQGNAAAQYLYSTVARKMGNLKEASKALDYATSFDCIRWRGNGIYNSIIRRLAKKHEVFLFDFDYYIRDNWNKNITFFDKIYPQDYYYEKASESIGRLLKKVLKL